MHGLVLFTSFLITFESTLLLHLDSCVLKWNVVGMEAQEMGCEGTVPGVREGG